jgi:hypothetical protein
MSAPRISLPRHLVIEESAVVLGEKLGEGAFGMVHRGTLHGQAVCVKVRKSVQHGFGNQAFVYAAFFGVVSPPVVRFLWGLELHLQCVLEVLSLSVMTALLVFKRRCR